MDKSGLMTLERERKPDSGDRHQTFYNFYFVIIQSPPNSGPIWKAPLFSCSGHPQWSFSKFLRFQFSYQSPTQAQSTQILSGFMQVSIWVISLTNAIAAWEAEPERLLL
jgi:hypothetical protein